MTEQSPIARLFVLPAVLLIVAVLAFPFLFNIYLGFTDASALTGLTGAHFVGLANYPLVFGDPGFGYSLRLTFLWTAITLCGQLLLGLLLALLLHWGLWRATRWLHSVWLLPWVIPSAAVFYVWRLLFNPSIGPIDSAIRQVADLRVPILADPNLALWAVMVAAMWKGYPFFMVLFHSTLRGVPVELYDAARVDGARRWQVFWYIERPELRGIAAIAGIVGFIWAFNEVTSILVMTSGGPGIATRTLAVYVYQEAILGFRYSTAAVAATTLAAIVLGLFVVLTLLRHRTTKASLV